MYWQQQQLWGPPGCIGMHMADPLKFVGSSTEVLALPELFSVVEKASLPTLSVRFLAARNRHACHLQSIHHFLTIGCHIT